MQWYVAYWEDRAKSRIASSGKQKREDYELAILETKMKEATGQLVEKKEAIMVWSAAFMRLGKGIDSTISALKREMSWSPDSARIVKAHFDQLRVNFVRDSAEYIDVVDEKPSDAGSKTRP